LPDHPPPVPRAAVANGDRAPADKAEDSEGERDHPSNEERDGVVDDTESSGEDGEEEQGEHQQRRGDEVEGATTRASDGRQAANEAGAVTNAAGLGTPVGDDDAFAIDAFLDAAGGQPQLFMARSPATTTACRRFVKHLFDRQTSFERETQSTTGGGGAERKKKRSRSRVPLGPLARVEVGGVFEADQIWEELALRNRPLGAFLEREVDRAVRAAEVRRARGETAEDAENVALSEGRPLASDDPPPASGEGAAEAAAGAASEESSGSEGDSDGEAPAPPPKKVRFSVDAGEGDCRQAGDGAGGDDGKVEDGFFSLTDMETFADEAEELALDGRLMADSDDEGGAEGGSDDGGDEDEEDGLDLTLRGKLNRGAAQTSVRIRYEDFFDAPGGDAGGDEDAERALRRATMFHDGDSDDDEGGAGAAKTPLEVEREKLRESTAALEDANVAKRPWQLRGEVDGHGRPVNSLLESELEHDVAARPRVAPTAAATASIEDIIRQRVFDGLFDDVVHKLAADYDVARGRQRDPRPEISQDKPEEGLAELYEREFAEEREKVSKAAEAASEITVRKQDAEDNPEQAEVNRLFKRLSNKLDALSSLHFTPAPPKLPTEMEVKPNVPALAAEEAIPEAVSDAALLAPREVHAAAAKDLQGEVETDKVERRKRRRAKKHRISGANRRAADRERLEEMAHPALAEQRRAERTLQRPGRLLKKVANPNDKNKSKKRRNTATRDLEDVGSRTGDFAKSTRFFTQLQETVHQDLAGRKSKTGAGEVSDGATAARLKL
jgi:U3 small nucleolar RNA-associated protein MPP10